MRIMLLKKDLSCLCLISINFIQNWILFGLLARQICNRDVSLVVIIILIIKQAW